MRRRLPEGALGDIVGWVLGVDDDGLTVADRRGREHRVAWTAVLALRTVGVALGRDPLRTPLDLLDALADRAGLSGRVFVARLSELLGGRRPPASVLTGGDILAVDGGFARCEGEWVTAPAGADLVAVAWWGARRDARSMQVRTDDPQAVARLLALGAFRELPGRD